MTFPNLDGLVASLIQAVVAADTTIQGLTGGNPADPRVYWFYQAEALESQSMPAYISWAQLGSGQERGGICEPVYSFRIYSFDLDRSLLLDARLNEIFDKQQHTLSDPASTKVSTSRVQSNDMFDQTNKFAGREVHIRFGALVAGR